MKTTRFVVVFIFGICVMSNALWASSVAKSGYIEKVITVSQGGVSKTQTSKTYWEGDKMRTENLFGNQLMVNIKNGKALYTYSPSEKRAIKTVVDVPTVSEMFEQQFANIGKMKDVKKVGTGSVLGFKCDIYQRTIKGNQGNMTVKVWVSTDKRLPTALKMVATGPRGTTTEETKSIKLNIDVPDSYFVIPKGTTVKEVKPGEMPRGQQPPKSGTKK